MIDVRRAAERFATRSERLTSRHSFSFGAHYDPGDVGFAALVAHNEDVVAPGAGYATHPHTDVEIVTWVLEGSLVHADSSGRSAEIRPGAVQRISAGTGIRHSERNDSPGAAVATRFVQMWLRPDESGLTPSYEQREVDGPGGPGGLVPLVSGIDGLDAAVRIQTSGAALHVGRPAPGEPVITPDAARLHLFVARGTVEVEGAGSFVEGDAVRFTDEGGPRVTAPGGPAEVLVWQLS